MPANRNEAGRFVGGQSGNPSGRPKIPQELRMKIRDACPEAVNTLIELLHSKKEMIRLQAAHELLDRGYGKPEAMSKVELSTGEKEKIVFQWIGQEKSSEIEGTGSDEKP